METSAELVDAAEAMRTWVRAQRAAWAEPVSDTATAVAVDDRDLADTRAIAATPAVVIPIPPSTVQPKANATPPPAVEAVRLTPAPGPASSVSANAIDSAAPTIADLPVPEAHAAPSVPLFERGWIRLASAAAVIALLAIGLSVSGLRAWRSYQARPRVGTASVQSTPPGADVLVDGNPVGTTPLRVELPAGEHAVELRLKGASRTETVDVVRGAEATLNVDWNQTRVGSLAVASTPPQAHVFVDGRDRGVTPLTVADLTVGAHTVRIDSSEGSVTRRVQIGEGRTETLTESIFAGWLEVSAPIEVTIVDGTQPIQLDSRGRVFLKPGVHELRIENRALAFSQTRRVTIEPGGTAVVAIELPPSTLSVTGPAGAQVFVDGVNAGVLPLTDYQVKLGTRDVMIVDASGSTRHATITVTSAPAHLDLTSAPR
jgi:hypothetical protein